MKVRQLLSLLAALGAAGAIGAQTPDTTENTRQSQETPAQSSETAQGAESSQPSTPEPSTDRSMPDATPGTVTQPAPATTRDEGTAADRTPPGATPTRPVDPGTVNPMPATTQAEGTAADHSPPGETPVRGTAASQAPDQVTSRMAAASRGEMEHDRRASQLIGLAVRDKQGSTIGEVRDVIIDPASGRVTHAVIAQRRATGAAGQNLSAVPWSAVSSMMRDGWVEMDASRLNQAPSFQQGQWPNMSGSGWSSEADRYWQSDRAKGEMQR